jgi:hypothetical protein
LCSSGLDGIYHLTNFGVLRGTDDSCLDNLPGLMDALDEVTTTASAIHR